MQRASINAQTMAPVKQACANVKEAGVGRHVTSGLAKIIASVVATV